MQPRNYGDESRHQGSKDHFGHRNPGDHQQLGDSYNGAQVPRSARQTAPSSMRYQPGNTSGPRSHLNRSMLYPQLNAPNLESEPTRREEERFYTPLQALYSGNTDGPLSTNIGGPRQQLRDSKQPFEPAFSPHLHQKRRGLANISESQFQTPLQSMRGHRNVEDDSTVKPNLRDTVARSSLNVMNCSQMVPKSRSLRLANHHGILGNQRSFGGGGFNSANFLNRTGVGYGGHPSPLPKKLFQQPTFGRAGGPIQDQQRSPQFGEGAPTDRQPAVHRSPWALPQDLARREQTFPATYDAGLNASQHTGEGEMRSDFITKLSFDEQQKAINSCRTIVEDLAAEQADPGVNDLSRQLDKRMPDGSAVAPQHHRYEFEPNQFQASAQSLIPRAVRRLIKEVQDRLRDPEHVNGLTPVQLLNLRECVGSYAEDHHYIALGRTLTLWKSATRTQHGVNVFKEGAAIPAASASERQRAVEKLNGEYTQVDFSDPIQRVHYVEHNEQSSRPCLIVVTQEEIQLMRFKKIDQSFNRLDISSMDTNQANAARTLRQKYDLTQLEPSDYAPFTIERGEEISRMIQVRKSGRIFYASHTEDYKRTYVKELQFSETAEEVRWFGFTSKNVQRIASSVLGANKRILSRNLLVNPVLRAAAAVLPSWLDYSSRKCVRDLQVDESRNIVYSLTSRLVKQSIGSRPDSDMDQEESDDLENRGPPGECQQIDVMEEQAIDVYDLGILGGEFKNVCKITQEQLFQRLPELLSLPISKNTEEYRKELHLHQISSMHSITSAESGQRHLLLTTENGLRIYLQFRTDPEPAGHGQVSPVDVERLRLQHETWREECFDAHWTISSVHSMPVISEALEVYGRGAADGHHPNPFRINEMSRQKHGLQHGDESQRGNSGVLPTFCNNSSALIYTDGQPLALPSGMDDHYLNINFLTKNEGSYCIARARARDQPHQCINETFSMLQIQKLEGGLDDEQDDEMDEVARNEQRAQEDEEFILQIRDPNEDSYNLGYLNREISLDLQKVLGASPALRLDPLWGYSNFLHSMALSVMEKQVYEAACLQPIKVLTNKRHLTVVQLRPIDQLAQILVSTAGQPAETYSLNEFEAFAHKFGLEEVCSMLVQIISEQHHGRYYHSRKVHQAIIQARQSERRQQYARTQSLGDRAGQFSHYVQPRQAGGLNSTLMRATPITQRSVGTRPRFQFTASAGMSAHSLGRSGFVEREAPVRALSGPFVFNQNEEYLGRSPYIDQGHQRLANHQRLEPVTDEEIVADMYSPQNEINSNCSLQVLEGHQPSIKLAQALLMIYGDSFCASAAGKAGRYYQTPSQQVQAILDPKLLTLRYKAIFLYAQRILRPIWDMNITQRQSRSQPLDKQRMNVEVFEPALIKLTNLSNMLESSQKDLSFQTSLEDQTKLLGGDVAQARSQEELGIQSEEICGQVRFTCALDNQVKEKIEQSQRKVLGSLMVFIRRCIDAIQFLKIISFQQNIEAKTRRELFQAMTERIHKSRNGKASLKELSETKYKDLVLQGGSQETLFACYPDETVGQIILDALGSSEAQGTEKSQLIRTLYSSSIDIAVARENGPEAAPGVLNGGSNVQSAIQQRALQIQRLCPTMFSQSQTTTFVGQSILHQAVTETDSSKREALIRQGLAQLLKLPQNINLQAVVPDLCKTGRYLAIVDLCMRKIQSLEQIIGEGRAQRPSMSFTGSSARQRLNQSMHSASSSHGDRNQSQMALDDFRDQHILTIECYDVICNLFLALDRSIQDLKDPSLVAKVELLLELKKHQRDDAAADYDGHFKAYSKSFQGTKWYQSFYHHFAVEVGHLAEKRAGAGGLASTQGGIHTKQGKIQLRRHIVQKVEDCGDFRLIKTLFVYMIGQPREYIQLEDLPRIDYATFMDLCRHLFAQPEISKVSIDTLIKLMTEKDRFVSQQAAEHEKAETRSQIKQRLCEFVLRLCQDNMLKVVKPVPSPSPAENQGALAGSKGKQAEVIHLTCREKIGYCQLAIDQVQGLGASHEEPSRPSHIKPPVNFVELVKQLQECIDTLRYQIKTMEAAQERIKDLELFETKANEKLKTKIRSKIDELKQQKIVLDTLNSKRSDLYLDFVEKYSLYRLMYEHTRSEEQRLEQLLRYDDSHETQQGQIEAEYLRIFDLSLKEVIALTHDSVELKLQRPADGHATRRWKNSEVIKHAFKCFQTLRTFTASRNVALQALKRIVKFKIDDFINNYGHDTQAAFDLLIGFIKEIIAKGEITKNEEFAMVGLHLEAVCSQHQSAEIRADDIRGILQEMYERAPQSSREKHGRDGSATLLSNLILCHMLVHLYGWVNAYVKCQKTTSPSVGVVALQADLQQLLSPQPGIAAPGPAMIDHQLNKIDAIFADYDLQLPKEYGNTIKQFIEVVRKDVADLQRRPDRPRPAAGPR